MSFRPLRRFLQREVPAVKRQLRAQLQVESLEVRMVPTALSWSVQSDYLGTILPTSQARSLRGLALSDNGSSIYGGFILGSTSAALRKVSSATIPGTITTGSPAIQAVVSTFPLQAKGVATDDRGNVFITLNNASPQTSLQFKIYDSNLTSVIGTGTSTTTDPTSLSGLSVQKLGTKYYLYLGHNSDSLAMPNSSTGLIDRWDVTNPAAPVLDTSWGVGGRFDLTAVAGPYAHATGLEAEADGTLYVAGAVSPATAGTRGDSVFKISANGSTLLAQNNTVPGAMDVALFQGKVYATEYLASASTIVVLNESNLLQVDTLPTGIPHPFAGSDSGYSGIAIKNSNIYVADQRYGDDGTNFQDRILVASLDTQGPVTSNVAVTPNPVALTYAGSLTVTATVDDTTTGGSNIASAEYSVDGGTWHAMAATDGNFDEVSENVTASFTLASVGITTAGPHTVAVRGKDAAGNTGPATTTTLLVGPGSFVSGGDLIVIGTDCDDCIEIEMECHGRIEVEIEREHFHSEQTFSSTGINRIIVYGLGGDDCIEVEENVTIPSFLFGGDGDDELESEGGASVLVGGKGNDELKGDKVRNILIGGQGKDHLSSKDGQDILIGGYTDFDNDVNMLSSLLNTWRTGADSTYNARVAALSSVLNSTTVHNDFAKDELSGGSGLDWFIASQLDKLDNKNGETVTLV